MEARHGMQTAWVCAGILARMRFLLEMATRHKRPRQLSQELLTVVLVRTLSISITRTDISPHNSSAGRHHQHIDNLLCPNISTPGSPWRILPKKN